MKNYASSWLFTRIRRSVCKLCGSVDLHKQLSTVVSYKTWSEFK